MGTERGHSCSQLTRQPGREPRVQHVQNSILDQIPTNRQKCNPHPASILILSILSKPQLLQALIYGCVKSVTLRSFYGAHVRLNGTVSHSVLMIEI